MTTEATLMLPLCPNKKHHSSSYSIIHYGFRKSSKGLRLRYLCRNADGTHHAFLALPSGEPSVDGRTKEQLVKCPDPKHRGSKVLSKGRALSASGNWDRYYCRSTNYPPHYFRLLTAQGPSRVETTKPPICPEHPKSKIVRNGTKGSGAAKRQSYYCEPVGGTRHRFSPALSRQAVAPMSSCAGCDELLSPHKGALTASRHTPWTLTSIVQSLNNLSLGRSYAEVGIELRAQHRAVTSHHHGTHHAAVGAGSATATGAAATTATGASAATLAATEVAAAASTPSASSSLDSSSSSSFSRDQGRNTWHLAANLVEQYSPILFKETSRAIVEREKKLRAKNDAILAENPETTLRAPIVYLLDDVPIFINSRGSKRVRNQNNAWAMLVVVELLWNEPKDPFSYPTSDARLRLVRAYPRNSEEAWALVLNELEVVPDFIIADASPSINAAYLRTYTNRKPTFIPSLYHINKNIREVLAKVPGGATKKGKKVYLNKLINEAASFMSRDDLVKLTPKELSASWDKLIAAVAATDGKTKQIIGQRISNEPRMLESIKTLTKYPFLPASNASVESKIRKDLDQFLENRKARYRNLARTNFLLDLAVCRSQGAFNDLEKLGKLIRESNEAASGWAPAPRAITDHQPLGVGVSAPIYSSLLSTPLLTKLSAARGIAPAQPKVPKPMKSSIQFPGTGSGRRKGSKNKPKPVAK